MKKPHWKSLNRFQAPGLVSFNKANYEVGYIDLQSQEVIPPGDLSKRIGQGLIWSGSFGGAHFSSINIQGKTAIPGPFNRADDFGESGPNVAPLQGHWGLLTASGQRLVDSSQLRS